MEISPKILFVFRLIIALSFIFMSIVILFVWQKTNLEQTNAYLFATLLLIYGIFRLYRAINLYKY